MFEMLISESSFRLSNSKFALATSNEINSNLASVPSPVRVHFFFASHQTHFSSRGFTEDPLPLPQIPQRTLPSAFAQSRKVSEERGVKLTLNGLIPVQWVYPLEACVFVP